MAYRRAASGGQSKIRVARMSRGSCPSVKPLTGIRLFWIVISRRFRASGPPGKTDLHGIRVFRFHAGRTTGSFPGLARHWCLRSSRRRSCRSGSWG